MLGGAVSIGNGGGAERGTDWTFWQSTIDSELRVVIES